VTDRDGSGSITWEEFCAALNDDEMGRFMKSLEIDAEEAKGLFLLLDADGSGTVDSEEFTQGCLRLRGPARAIDVSTMMYSNKRMVQWWREKIQSLEVSLMCIQEYLDEIPDATSTTQCSETPRGMPESPSQSEREQSLRASTLSEVHASASCHPRMEWGRQESDESSMAISRTMPSEGSEGGRSTTCIIFEGHRRASAGDSPNNRAPRKSMAQRTAGMMAIVERESSQETFLATWSDVKAEGKHRASNIGGNVLQAPNNNNNNISRRQKSPSLAIPE